MPIDNVVDLRMLRRQPSPRRYALLEERRAAQEAHIRDDVVSRATVDADHVELLHILREQVAGEAAALGFERIHGAHTPAVAAKLASRRIRALRDVADATLEIHGLEEGTASPAMMRKIVGLLLVDVLSAAESVLSKDAMARLSPVVQRRVGHLLDEMEENRLRV